jgi:hypothetical protein
VPTSKASHGAPVFQAPQRTVTGNATLTTADRVVYVDAGIGVVTITLPPVASTKDMIYTIKKIDVSVNVVTIDGDGAETIDDALTKLLSVQFASLTIQSDGTEWFIL